MLKKPKYQIISKYGASKYGSSKIRIKYFCTKIYKIYKLSSECLDRAID